MKTDKDDPITRFFFPRYKDTWVYHATTEEIRGVVWILVAALIVVIAMYVGMFYVGSRYH